MGMDIMSNWGILLPSSIVKTKPVNEILMETIVRNMGVDGITVKVCRICMFEQAL